MFGNTQVLKFFLQSIIESKMSKELAKEEIETAWKIKEEFMKEVKMG